VKFDRVVFIKIWEQTAIQTDGQIKELLRKLLFCQESVEAVVKKEENHKSGST